MWGKQEFESKSPNSVKALCLEAFHTASKIICKGEREREREKSFLFVFQKAHHLEAEEVLCVVYKHTHSTYYILLLDLNSVLVCTMSDDQFDLIFFDFLLFSCDFQQQFIITYVNIKFNLNWYKFSWTWKDTC